MEETIEKDIHFLDYWRVVRSRKEIILAVTLLVVVTATAYTFTRPKIYMANARISVGQDSLNTEVFHSSQSQTGYNPIFVATQYEIIKSRQILYDVIRNLDLQRKWAATFEVEGLIPIEDCFKILDDQVKVRPYRDTTLIDILAYNQDPEEAAEIANAVVSAYANYRLNHIREEVSGSIRVLRSEIEKQEEKVSTAENGLQTIRKETDFSLVGGRLDSASYQLQELEKDRIDARVDMMVRKARLDKILAMGNKELLYSIDYIARDPTLSRYKDALVDMELSLKLVQQQLGPEHPDVIRLLMGRDLMRTNLTDAVKGLKAGLNADLEVAEQRYEELNMAIEEVRQESIDAQGTSHVRISREYRKVALETEILNALRARIAQEGIEIQMPRSPVEVIENALASDENKPVSPNYLFNILVSIVVGLGLGIGMAYFIEYLDTSVKTVEDVEQHLGLPVIGIIPQKVRPLSEEGPDNPHAEAYRLLRTNMLFSNKGGAGGGAFAVASGGVGEGKSTTLFNLAYVCAQLGDKVLIVDSDLRRPVQHTFLDMSNRSGLTNLLVREVSIEEIIKPTTIPNLHFLSSGRIPRAASGLLDSERMRDLVKNLKARYDYVFFDSPPLMGVSDASILASEVDGVLLVIQYRKYPRTMSTRAKRVIENVGGNILGVVLNNINVMRDDYYSYYHGQYPYYYSRSEESIKPTDDQAAGGEDSRKKPEKEEVF